MLGSLAKALDGTHLPVGGKCRVSKILAELDADDRAQVEAWLAHPNVPGHTHVARALTAIGHRILADSVGRHRRGDCNCGKSG